jgi:DNA-binding LacI/PurR family transcriptional regulator
MANRRSPGSAEAPGAPETPPRRMDIRDVARCAKVSVSTVSRVMNGVTSVNPRMAARVWRAVRELNYLPNTQARSLVSGRSRMLGLIVSEITNPFFPELIERFEQCAVDGGYEVLIASTGYDPARTAVCLRRMVERNVDGVAVMTFGAERPLLEELISRNVPLVFIDAGASLPGSTMLHVDYRQGIEQAVQHLAALGHRSIGFISGPLSQKSAVMRKDAFTAAMRGIGAAAGGRAMIEGDHTLEGGISAAQKLFRLASPPTALICSNDMTAIGVLHHLYERGLNAPRDVSVVGFDDVRIAQFTLPPLTTVRMSCEDIARAAVRTLRGKLEGSGFAPGPIPTQLIVRQTTGYPRDTRMGAAGGRPAPDLEANGRARKKKPALKRERRVGRGAPEPDALDKSTAGSYT